MAETQTIQGRWQAELERFLEPFLPCLHHEKQRHWAPVYLRGLLGPGERKSMTRICDQVAPGEDDQINNFIAVAPWDIEAVQRVLARVADGLVGGADSHLIVDDVGWPKKGERSVGVARQYCGAVGKVANCQVAVSLTLARAEVPVPIALRLYLPQAWANDPKRRQAAGVPKSVQFEPKWRIALGEIRKARAAGVRFGDVLGDAEYGKSAEFRAGLDDLALEWAVGIEPQQKLYGPAAAGRGQRVRGLTFAREAIAAQTLIGRLEATAWRRISWRVGTKGKLSCRWAAVRVLVADGDAIAPGVRLPGREVWLVCEWRQTGEKKYYFSSLGRRASRRRLAGQIKGRWACEQGHQQMKEELGLDHFEGRGWLGLHHHLLLTMMALAFLQSLRLAEAKKGSLRRRRGSPRPRSGRGRRPGPRCPRCAGPLSSAAG